MKHYKIFRIKNYENNLNLLELELNKFSKKGYEIRQSMSTDKIIDYPKTGEETSDFIAIMQKEMP